MYDKRKDLMMRNILLDISSIFGHLTLDAKFSDTRWHLGHFTETWHKNSRVHCTNQSKTTSVKMTFATRTCDVEMNAKIFSSTLWN